ncbi:hypothetical protein [Halogeometricum limi]|uniref:Uncharacterized protein n=1 Tax=Halogeometricum limi TaxID=555875 RepID=A0A1I6G7Z4_9EURY|nr:hypothetical protein [Halogeometricum limi]SFR38260.1 hypothetical protein SAMN04488124_0996 [Halogeometricum limi]
MYFGLTSVDVSLERGPPIRLSPGLAAASFRFVASVPKEIRDGVHRVAVHDQGDGSFDVRFTGRTDGAYVVDAPVLEDIVWSLADEKEYGEWRVEYGGARPEWVPDEMPRQETHRGGRSL